MLHPHTAKCTWERWFDGIRAVGPAPPILSSDIGQLFNPPVEDGLAMMADRLLDAGFSDANVRTMAVDEHARSQEGGVSRRLLVIGAHSADFVWRAGGALALTTENGGGASVIALSYGEKGESGELWKEQDQTIDNVKQMRHGEAETAAAVLGADFRCFDLGDYPLEVAGPALDQLVDAIREIAPDAIVTHTDRDPFNPDHPVAFHAVERARALAAGAGVSSAFPTVRPPALFLFEPHQPELCNFTPTTFLDITAVIDKKRRRWPR